MTSKKTKLNFQEDSIQLIEVVSNGSSAENVQSPSLTKFKKKNKVDSPRTGDVSPVLSLSSNSKISDVFIVKSNVDNNKNPPVPAPRKLRNIKNCVHEFDESEKSNNTLESVDNISGRSDKRSNYSSEKSLTYKDTVRSRFLTIKKQAQLSTSKITEKTTKKSTFKDKKQSVEIVEKILQQEECAINIELNKHEKHKGEGDWKKEKNSYDFFFGTYESSETECEKSEVSDTSDASKKLEQSAKLKLPTQGKASDNSNNEIEIDEKNSNNESKQSVTDFLGIENLDTEIVEFILPDVLDISLNEKEMFKVVKRYNKRSDDLHYQEDLELKFLEEDGIFKPLKPEISNKELLFFEDQLYLEENRDWFAADGELKILSDPRLEQYFRPFPTKQKRSDFVTDYIPPTVFKPIENFYSDNTLEFVIYDITFYHHHLFTNEHVLAQQLKHFYEKYIILKEKNLYFLCRKKLEALRAAKNRLKSMTNLNSLMVKEKYNKYLIDIKEIREKMYAEAQKERKLKLVIIKIWQGLKKVRENQKYSNTNINLIINKLTSVTDVEHESELWEENINEEIMEIVEEYDKKYNQEKEEYKKRIKLWQDQQIQKELDENDDELLDEITEKPKKPKKNINKEEIQKEVVKKCEECLKQPQEPNIDFELHCDNEISAKIDANNEKWRRSFVSKTQIYFKIMYENTEICKSKIVPLNDNFICEFNQSISVKLIRVPQSLNLQIYEQSSSLKKNLISEINIALPEYNTTVEKSDKKESFFENKNIIRDKYTAVGTGIQLKNVVNLKNFDKYFTDNNTLFSTGKISYKLGWGIYSVLLPLEEQTPENNINHENLQKDYAQFPTIFNVHELQKWVERSPDPLDPKNASFFDFVQDIKITTTSDKSYFRLDPDLNCLDFCVASEIENNLRFKLLKLRNSNEMEFKNIVVPNRIKEISPEIFEDYERRKKEETISTELIIEQLKNENIDLHRKWAYKFLNQTEHRIIQLSKIAEKRISLNDVLNEDLVPSFGSLGMSFVNWLQPKRPLRPSRKPGVQKRRAISASFKEINILVNIASATQVPSRKENWNDQRSPRTKDKINIFPVRPFVTVNFQNNCVKTTVAEGPNPVWNQELVLTMRSKNDTLTVPFLQNMKELIHINLFDETMEDLVEDDRLRETNIHQQIGCNWLGKIEIPFSTLLYTNRIEGIFKVNIPPILLGYEPQTIRSLQNDDSYEKTDTFISIFISMQPLVPNVQLCLKTELTCSEYPFIEEHITNWQNEYNSQFSHRQFSSLVTTMNGERSCITRFLKSIQLPPLLENVSENADLEIARFVSLIPFKENCSIGLIPDVFLTTDQFLTLMMGTTTDHAVLLTCYFITLEIKCWLLLGFGLPHGPTAFVLTQEKTVLGNKLFIYDVQTGEKHHIYDNSCPLQKVYYVVNEENIWANIQCEDRINVTKFDFSKTAEWLPLFDRNILAPSNFQSISPIYFSKPSVENLQEKIEQKLKQKFMKWRKHTRTIWNIYCSSAFKKLLIKFEENWGNNLEAFSTPERFREVNNLLNSYQVQGFTKCFPYTSINNLIDFVQSTGMHLNNNPNMEFTLSCYMQSFNNNTVVIWLFLATLIKIK